MSRCAERRKHPVGFDPRRERRQWVALGNQQDRARRDDAEQLGRLDMRPGSSARERARIWEREVLA